MNMAMEMHDSYLLELHTEADGTGHALFHAVVFRSERLPGEDAQESGWQNVRMCFNGMVVEGRSSFNRPYASNGFLSIDGIRDNGLIGFPFDHTGSIILSMDLSDDFETTTIYGNSISIVAEGEFEWEATWNADGTIIRT